MSLFEQIESKYRCSHCGGLPVDFYSNSVYKYLFEKAQLVIDQFGHVPAVSSGYRCTEHSLTKGLSAHTFGVAIDWDLNGVPETNRFAQCVEDVFPHFRMGVYVTGGQSFVHTDVAFLISPRGSEKWHMGARW